jgi:hypothetical protein
VLAVDSVTHAETGIIPAQTPKVEEPKKVFGISEIRGAPFAPLTHRDSLKSGGVLIRDLRGDGDIALVIHPDDLGDSATQKAIEARLKTAFGWTKVPDSLQPSTLASSALSTPMIVDARLDAFSFVLKMAASKAKPLIIQNAQGDRLLYFSLRHKPDGP